MFPLLMKTALKTCPDSIQPTFINLVEQGIKLFIANPPANAIMLTLWSTVLDEYSKQPIRN
jgi:hypothetical protein